MQVRTVRGNHPLAEPQSAILLEKMKYLFFFVFLVFTLLLLCNSNDPVFRQSDALQSINQINCDSP